MNNPVFMFNAIFVLVFSVFVYKLWSGWRRYAKAEYIRSYQLPPGLYAKLQKKRPLLSHKECELTGQAMRQFFLAYLKSGKKYVSMPSQVTDELWHEFILYTRHYEVFCKRAFGQFLHHTPAVVLGKRRIGNEGLRRCWWYACREENINPKMPLRLPLLFAIDHKLKIVDGFIYTPDCSKLHSRQASDGTSVYCGGDFASSDYDGSTDGFGDSGDAGGNSGDAGCGGGCGGD